MKLFNSKHSQGCIGASNLLKTSIATKWAMIIITVSVQTIPVLAIGRATAELAIRIFHSFQAEINNTMFYFKWRKILLFIKICNELVDQTCIYHKLSSIWWCFNRFLTCLKTYKRPYIRKRDTLVWKIFTCLTLWALSTTINLFQFVYQQAKWHLLGMKAVFKHQNFANISS